jgi:ring-1,2-phenylacetyl-CoA epoxidase subunit PaaE
MNNSLLEMLAPKHLQYSREKAQFFICGPAEYMRMAQFTLTFMGFRADQLHKENFVVDTAGKIARTQIPSDTSVKQVLLKHENKTQALPVPGNETILQAALRQNVPLPYSCKGGVCGSCIAQCTSGKVWMSVNEVLTDKELSKGLVLTCTGYAQSDEVTLEW